MAQTEKCIYCGELFDPYRGEGDHVFSVQLGEFRNDIRFRRMCPPCNNKIGRSEQQFLLCGPENFFRNIVQPKIPKKRQRGRSQVKTCLGVPTPESTIDHSDHRQLVRRSTDNPSDVLSIDQLVIHDCSGQEYFVQLFSGMPPEQLKSRIEKLGINKIEKTWLHCDKGCWPEFDQLVSEMWPKSQMQSLPGTEVGVTQVNGAIAFKVSDHYFRSLAKIAFHCYLTHSCRGFRGDEECFETIRDFIMNGGNHESIFDPKGPKFAMPFGEIPSGGVITPKGWCHVVAADETDRVAVVYLQLFVGPRCVPQPHYIKLADINSHILVPNSTWGYVYLYDESPGTDRYAGRVEPAQITRIR